MQEIAVNPGDGTLWDRHVILPNPNYQGLAEVTSSCHSPIRLAMLEGEVYL
jgi:hypothetical protein